MNSLRAYLSSRKRILGYLLFCFLILILIFILYRFPLEALIYGLLLCLAAGLVPLALDYGDYKRRWDTLRWLESQLEEIDDHLPPPRDTLEKAYQELVVSLQRSRLTERAQAAYSRSNMLEYYTMWVHQIKTPIAAMGMLLQSESGLDRELIGQQLFRIQEYVEMVLTYLRMEDMGTDLDLHRNDLDELVRAAVKKYSRTFIHRHLYLHYEPLKVRVLTDGKWLQFVIEQVLSNALKYTHSGGISIYLDQAHPCRLVIEDTGIGIRAEDLPRVFERGFTGLNGRVDKNATGIGLYLCQGIMKRLSHEIGIESEEGKGTRVWMDLDSMSVQWE